jgi:hypothetical protein
MTSFPSKKAMGRNSSLALTRCFLGVGDGGQDPNDREAHYYQLRARRADRAREES